MMANLTFAKSTFIHSYNRMTRQLCTSYFSYIHVIHLAIFIGRQVTLDNTQYVLCTDYKLYYLFNNHSMYYPFVIGVPMLTRERCDRIVFGWNMALN